jgi:hypothetical protein
MASLVLKTKCTLIQFYKAKISLIDFQLSAGTFYLQFPSILKAKN